MTEPRSPTFLARASSLFGAAAVASALAAVPPALRVASSETVNALGAWLALVACGLPLAALGIGVLRGARVAWALFDGEDAWVDAAGIALWALTMLLVFTGLGAGLRATTHHHALAGVTFALVGAALGTFVGFATRRALTLVKSFTPAARAILLIGAFASLVLLVLALSVRLGAVGPFSPTASALVVDAVAMAVTITCLSSRMFIRGWLARLGVPLAGGLFALGIAVLAQSNAMGGAIRDHAPAYAWLLGLGRPG